MRHIVFAEHSEEEAVEIFKKAKGSHPEEKQNNPFSIIMREGVVYMVSDGPDKRVDLYLILKEIKRVFKRLHPSTKFYRYFNSWIRVLGEHEKNFNIEGLINDMSTVSRGMDGWMKLRVLRWIKLLGYIKMFKQVKKSK